MREKEWDRGMLGKGIFGSRQVVYAFVCIHSTVLLWNFLSGYMGILICCIVHLA